MNTGTQVRREFLKRASAATAAALLNVRGLCAAGQLSNPVGYATIAWPDSEIKHALETISNLGFQGVQMLGFVREMFAGARAGELRDQLKSLHLQSVTLSCSDVDLKPEDARDETGQVRSYADFQKRGSRCRARPLQEFPPHLRACVHGGSSPGESLRQKCPSVNRKLALRRRDN